MIEGFEATHMIGEVPVMLVKEAKKPPYYVTAEGIRKGASKQYKPVPIGGPPPVPVATVPAVAAIDEGLPPEEQDAPEDIQSGPYGFTLTLDEFGVCAEAILTQHRGELHSTVAIYRGPREVLFSRREGGADMRRVITLPETVVVSAQDAR